MIWPPILYVAWGFLGGVLFVWMIRSWKRW